MSVSMENNLDRVYNYVKKYIYNNGYAPSIREIMNSLNIKSTSSVHLYLKKLDEKGKIIFAGENKSRAIELTNKNINMDSIKKIPMIGEIPAGTPRLAIENIDEDEIYIFSKCLFPSSGELFMLNVVGSSMIKAGIFDGDLIVVRKQNTAENGQIVVAMIEDSATVKRFYKEKNFFRLKPENELMCDIITKELNILGIVIGLIRNRI